jgi:hypothetical protein
MIQGYTQFFESKNTVEPHQKEMYDGIVDILKRVRDLKNREEIAVHMLKDFKKEKINVDKQSFIKDCGL